MSKLIALLAASLVLAGAATGKSGPGFSAHVTNQWFPLTPGSRWVYQGVKDGKRSREVMTVTRRVVKVGGAPCVAVDDRLWLAGKLEERTTDYYTQDSRGTVWYFGEDTAELTPAGKVKTTEGSWRTGRDGAKPGIFMPAHPKVGQSFRQEYLKGQAEDHFRVVGFLGPNAILTEEWTPLEPGVLDHKMYARGTGTVLERTVKGGDELNELVSFRRG